MSSAKLESRWPMAENALRQHRRVSPSPNRLLLMSSGRGWAGGGEEVDQQLVDAFGLVVVDPVRCVGQTLDALEVGHVVVVRLGERGAEVAVALAPDDEGGRSDGTDLA